MARYRLLKDVAGLKAGTTIADIPAYAGGDDVIAPELCRAPDIEVLMPLDARAVNIYASLGVITTEGA